MTSEKHMKKRVPRTDIVIMFMCPVSRVGDFSQSNAVGMRWNDLVFVRQFFVFLLCDHVHVLQRHQDIKFSVFTFCQLWHVLHIFDVGSEKGPQKS